MREQFVAGMVPAVSVHKVVDACAGLDVDACAAVDAQVAPRLGGCDPARVTSMARHVAARVAADQVAAQSEPDPPRADRRGPPRRRRADLVVGAAAERHQRSRPFAALDRLAADYRDVDDTLTVDQSRADAFGDLLLRNVRCHGQRDPGRAGAHRHRHDRTGRTGRRPGTGVDLADTDLVADPATGDLVPAGTLPADVRERLSWVQVPAEDDPCGGAGAMLDPRYTAAGRPRWSHRLRRRATRGRLGRRRHRRHPLRHPPAARRPRGPRRRHRHPDLADHHRLPPTRGAVRDLVRTRDGTCRMWGCTRAATHTDLDHVRPWPDGRHHGRQPRRPLPAPPPDEATRPMAPHPRSRRHPHLDQHHRPRPHHRTRPPHARRGARLGSPVMDMLRGTRSPRPG